MVISEKGGICLKIKVVTPILLDVFNKVMENYLKEYARPDTEIVVVNTEKGPETVECGYDKAYADLVATLEAEKAEREGYDAVIMNCFCDPGLEAAREKLKIPVIGPGQSSLLLASMLGQRISIITVGDPQAAMVYADYFGRLYGVESKVVSGRSVDVPVDELLADFDRLVKSLIECGRMAIEKDYADIIVLGCSGMVGVVEKLEEALGVPVIDPLLAALKMAETCVELKLTHSKRTFVAPPEKRRII